MPFPTSYHSNGFRIQKIKQSSDSNLTWLFLPGGPGMGSEAYLNFLPQLKLPGTLLLLDYHNDGSNTIPLYDYNQWRSDLTELIDEYESPIIIAHSFGAMLTLVTPKLKNKLTGLVILNSSPSKQWMAQIQVQAEKYNLPDTSETRVAYLMEPSNEKLKADILACAPYFFTPKTLNEGIKILEQLPYNFKPYPWAHQYLHPFYECLWVPDNLPCLIIGSELDHITPPHLFIEHPRFQAESIQFQVIPNAGHYPWLDNIELVCDIISQFANQF